MACLPILSFPHDSVLTAVFSPVFHALERSSTSSPLPSSPPSLPQSLQPFLSPAFSEHLLCAWDYLRSWGYSNEEIIKRSQPSRSWCVNAGHDSEQFVTVINTVEKGTAE